MRVRVRKREEIEIFLRAGKKGFFGGFLIGKKRDTKNEIKNVSK